MLAHLKSEANIGPHGIPMDVATDPKNQFMFEVGNPTADFAAKALDKASSDYYEKYFTARKLPIKSAGDLWSVQLKK